MLSPPNPRPLPSDFGLTQKNLHTFVPANVGLIPGADI